MPEAEEETPLSMVPEEGRMMEARSLWPLVELRPEDELLLSEERPLPDEDLLLPVLLLPDDLPAVDRLPVLLCFFWVVFFDLCPLLRRAVDVCAMIGNFNRCLKNKQIESSTGPICLYVWKNRAYLLRELRLLPPERLP